MATRFGLCDGCVHQRLVRTGRGSVFSLCERSRTDDRYPKYPRAPVVACPGFTPRQAREVQPPRGEAADPPQGGA